MEAVLIPSRADPHPCTLRDGTIIVLRPICPHDEPLMIRFHESLSDRSVLFRYFHSLNLGQRTAHDRLLRVCGNQDTAEFAIVAEARDAQSDQPSIIGVGRVCKLPNGKDAEFAVLVSDAWQRRGVGSALLQRLVDISKSEKVTHLYGLILSQNLAMQRMAKRLGFSVHGQVMDETVTASIRF